MTRRSTPPWLQCRCWILALLLLATTKAQMILLKEKSKSNQKGEDTQFEASSSSKQLPPQSLTRGGSAASHQRSSKVPSIHKRPSLSLLQSKEQSLSDHAARLLKGDSSFVNRLRQEEQQLLLQEPQQHTPRGPTPHVPTTNPWLLGAAALITASSLYVNGSSAMLQDLLQKTGSAVILAWLPSILLGGGLGWIEIASLVGLLLRPSVRQLLVHHFFPSLWTAVQKIAIAEVWRQYWLVVLPVLLLVPFPKPSSLVPLSTHHHYHLQTTAATPQWLQQCLNYIHKVADRFAQSTIRKTIQQSVHQTFGVAFEAMMVDTSSLWSESAEATVDVFVSNTVDADDQEETQEDVVALEDNDDNADDDDSGCQGGVCSI
jgi:hypothetical protein